MLIISLNDEYGNIDSVIFNDKYEDIIKVNDIVDIYGRVNRRKGQDQIIIDNLKVLE